MKKFISKLFSKISRKKSNYELLQQKKYFKSFFCSDFYLKEYLDVKDAKVDPLAHFITYGVYEFRKFHPELDMEYIKRRLIVKGREGENYLSFLSGEIDSYPDVDRESFNVNYDQKITKKELRDIKSLNIFDCEYYLDMYPDIKDAKIDPLIHYLTMGFIENRNPSSKFDTYYFKNKYQNNHKISPLLYIVRYHNHGDLSFTPEYSIQDKVFYKECGLQDKIALQVHLYYPEVIHELLPFIEKIKDSIDLFISVTSLENEKAINKIINDNNLDEITEVRRFENKGRDIAPLFCGFNDIWHKYEYVCHLHSKKSPHTHFGNRWRAYLFDQLIGDASKLRGMISFLNENKNIGVLYPENYFEIKRFVGSNGNDEQIAYLLNRIGLESGFEYVDFPAGSMCIMRTSAFKPLVESDISISDFNDEEQQIEGTLAHVLERCLTIIPRALGYETYSFSGLPSNPEYFAAAWKKKDKFIGLNSSKKSRWLRDTPEIALNERVELNPSYPYFNPQSLCIHWIIPDFGIGAGGHMTIFRIVKYLEEFGHRQIIWIQNANNYDDPNTAKLIVNKHYQDIGDNVIIQFLPEDVSHISGDIIIATDCWTVFPMMQMKRFKERFYFIQDWESMFHPVGDRHLMAELTYDFNLNALCAGNWLHSKAIERGMWARRWDLASDDKYYFYDKELINKNSKVTIAFYSRAYTSRRAVMLGITALKELYNRNVDIHVRFFGQNDLNFNVDFPHEYLGVLSPEQLGDLYRTSDIGLVFSATNYSLIPLEMMACGLPVVELDMESTRAVFDPSTIELVKADPLEIADRLEKLISSPNILKENSKKALGYVNNLSWEDSARAIELGLLDKLNEKFIPIDCHSLQSDPNEYNYKASIIIPTYNAGSDFKKILDSLLEQRTDFDYEVVIVDSGSSDETLDIIRTCGNSRVKLFEIPNSEFQHGRTRNYAISLSKGEFVTVITQDAMPVNLDWLSNLVSIFDKYPNAVGAFGAHKAYEYHSEFLKRDISQVFDNFNQLGESYSWNMMLNNGQQQGSIEWQLVLQFYSDNNSCMKKSVWKQLPYPEIEWGEDQAWAWMIIQLGLEKAYAKEAVVYHSHDDDYESKFKTSQAESKFFMDVFGLKLINPDIMVDEMISRIKSDEEKFALANKISEKDLDKQFEIVEATILGRIPA